ncbi:hypothetical protein TNCV_2525581 [Trichonephila clavipes]|nr:hypothetical protein TNCV_2525581 [Trichonephila clavipes]
MITNFFIPELNNHDVQELWFQQDGATCHTARATIDLLKDAFGHTLSPKNFDHRSQLYGNRKSSLMSYQFDKNQELQLHLRVTIGPAENHDMAAQNMTDPPP